MYITGSVYPFNSNEFRIYIDAERSNIQHEINSYPSEKLLNTSTSDLVEYLYKKYCIDTIPMLGEPIMSSPIDAKVCNPFYSGSEYDSEYFNGIALDFEVPFSGDCKFFNYQPSSWSTCYPHISIENDQIKFTLNLLKNEFENADEIKKEVSRTISALNKALETLREDARAFNSNIRSLAEQIIESRKADLLARNKLVASLGFQLKSTSQSYLITVTKKKISLLPPTASSEPYKPEPCLTEASYEEILKTLDWMSETMEKSPSAFKGMDEESIRCHFLVDLNGMFEGTASGETFNNKGKTDILISVEGKNIFIGECKFWKGESKFMETIDQILGYLTWRDTKACILVFNRNKNLTDVLKKIKEIIPKHQNFKRSICEKSETDFRYVFASNEDRNREIFLAVKVYDIPTEKE